MQRKECRRHDDGKSARMARREQVESEERSVEEREGGGGLSSVSEIIRSPLNTPPQDDASR